MKSLRGHLEHLAEVPLECQQTEVTACNSAVFDSQLSFLHSLCHLLSIFFYYYYYFHPGYLAGLSHLAKWEVSMYLVRGEVQSQVPSAHPEQVFFTGVCSHLVDRSPLKPMFSSVPHTRLQPDSC